jgi:agmatine/peptidylarginine deiminase
MLLAWPYQGAPSVAGEAAEAARQRERVLCNVVRAIWRSVGVVILVEDARAQEQAASSLLRADVPSGAVRFIEVPFALETEWIRDYSPMSVRANDGSYVLIDGSGLPDYSYLRAQRDAVSLSLGWLLGLRTLRASTGIENGNLLSNGQGLCIATRGLLEQNAARGFDQDQVTRAVKRFYGASEVVFLEKLQGELTGHVDMFAAFTSPDTVVVGEYTASSDPVNARILNRNAKRLEAVKASFGPLKVFRIPMPSRPEGESYWPTYTSVVFANDTLLVPVYPGLDPASERVALTLYRRLLPGWKVVRIDAAPLARDDGGLHCATLNLSGLGMLPAGSQALSSPVSADYGSVE